MKRYSTSLFIREIQIKPTMRYYLKLVRMAIITGEKCWQGCRGKGTLYPNKGIVNLCPHYGKQYGSFLKTELPCNLTISLLGLYPKEMKILSYMYYIIIYIYIYTHTICVIIYTAELYILSRLKQKENTLLLAITWVTPEGICYMKQVGQWKTNTEEYQSLTRGSEDSQTPQTESTVVGTRGWKVWEKGRCWSQSTNSHL